jgi:hypothetical protein
MDKKQVKDKKILPQDAAERRNLCFFRFIFLYVCVSFDSFSYSYTK